MAAGRVDCHMAVGFVALGGAFFADGWVGVGHGDASGEGVAVLCCALIGLRLSCAKGGGCAIARKQRNRGLFLEKERRSRGVTESRVTMK